MQKLNKEIAEKIRQLIFTKADEFGYTTRSKPESGQFMDALVEDPDVGGVLINLMPKENIRTYIKDGILNQYTKQKKNKILSQHNYATIIKNLYNENVTLIQTKNEVCICRSENNKIFLLSKGTILKWETALRKALDTATKYSNLAANEIVLEICLHLAITNKGIVESDKSQIKKALDLINVKVWFAE